MSDETVLADSKHEVAFTVDGEPFETDEPKQLASTILTNYAKVDPTQYQLGELEGKNPTPKLYANTDTVEIHEGARYVTVRIGPGPVQ
jgi:hypothetical protein